jgi:heme/copper-type cytochrome/quinol oxidase subunit 4
MMMLLLHLLAPLVSQEHINMLIILGIAIVTIAVQLLLFLLFYQIILLSNLWETTIRAIGHTELIEGTLRIIAFG